MAGFFGVLCAQTAIKTDAMTKQRIEALIVAYVVYMSYESQYNKKSFTFSFEHSLARVSLTEPTCLFRKLPTTNVKTMVIS